MSGKIAKKPIDVIAIPRKDYKDGIVAFMVYGHAMHDLIPDGSIVGVNTQDQDIISGEIYLIWLPHETNPLIRKVYANGRGLILKPENDKYETVMLESEDITDKTIQGRVLWYLSRRMLFKDSVAA